mmetsp:Transcript_96551/g.245471  ORF Transcript_96551/g.245471 Transcript_96551/m.245471 type:complete len:243 (+) Transcript_96551:42-770(+)
MQRPKPSSHRALPIQHLLHLRRHRRRRSGPLPGSASATGHLLRDGLDLDLVGGSGLLGPRAAQKPELVSELRLDISDKLVRTEEILSLLLVQAAEHGAPNLNQVRSHLGVRQLVLCPMACLYLQFAEALAPFLTTAVPVRQGEDLAPKAFALPQSPPGDIARGVRRTRSIASRRHSSGLLQPRQLARRGFVARLQLQNLLEICTSEFPLLRVEISTTPSEERLHIVRVERQRFLRHYPSPLG